MTRLNATDSIRAFIKAHEPFLGEAKQRGRRWVIGYGHTATAKHGMAIKPEDAELLLVYDVMQAEKAVNLAVGEDVPSSIKAALVSFAVSVGVKAFKVSDIARLSAAGKLNEAAAALESWVRAEEDGRLVTSQQLVARRAAEKDLMLQGLAPVEPVEVQTPSVNCAEETSTQTVHRDHQPSSQDEDDAFEVEHEIGPLIDVQIEIEDNPDPVVEDEQSVESLEVEPQPSQQDNEVPIHSVMARMARNMADSIQSPVEADEQIQEIAASSSETTQLGYYFLKQDFVEVVLEDENEDSDGVSEVSSSPTSTPNQVQASATGPVYGAVASVSEQCEDLTQEVDTDTDEVESPAPPHPSQAPANAPGLSGEITGPDHADDDADAEIITHETDMDLEPAMISVESELPSESIPVQHKQQAGHWFYVVTFILGLALIGFGVWEINTNLEAYMSLGIGFSALGPVTFAVGVMLAIASCWFVIAGLNRARVDS